MDDNTEITFILKIITGVMWSEACVPSVGLIHRVKSLSVVTLYISSHGMPLVQSKLFGWN